MEVTAITELDAVNEMLSVIGESPINTLENLQNIDAINALRILRLVNRQEQARGWSFNVISSLTLNPDVLTKKIRWQDNYLFLKGSNGEKLIRSGEYVKDLNADTEKFDSAITAEAILLVPFEDMPDPMRSYIIAKASLAFQTRYFNSPELTQITSQTLNETWMRLQEYEMTNNSYNILDNSDVSALKER
ncbi:MAG: phage tail protein [Phascolarctobacterium sp.]|nr:MAG: phage tail protein [Phascolarctobacterium sp.]